jgi:hypothetical protein
MNVDLDLLSVSDLARRIFFNDEAPCAESREDPRPIVPSQYMHETCGINFFIGSNKSLAWGIISLIKQIPNPTIQICLELAGYKK